MVSKMATGNQFKMACNVNTVTCDLSNMVSKIAYDNRFLPSDKEYFCYMTGENPVSWLAQYVFINLYVYLETGINRSTS